MMHIFQMNQLAGVHLGLLTRTGCGHLKCWHLGMQTFSTGSSLIDWALGSSFPSGAHSCIILYRIVALIGLYRSAGFSQVCIHGSARKKWLSKNLNLKKKSRLFPDLAEVKTWSRLPVTHSLQKNHIIGTFKQGPFVSAEMEGCSRMFDTYSLTL